MGHEKFQKKENPTTEEKERRHAIVVSGRNNPEKNKAVKDFMRKPIDPNRRLIAIAKQEPGEMGNGKPIEEIEK